MTESLPASERHVELIDLLERSTSRLTQTLGSLSVSDIGLDSGLPGWSRGHLLTHIANNAEGLTRLILGAVSGMSLPMYSSVDGRNSDIEAGATRPGSVIKDHALLATKTLNAAIATVTDWDAPAVFHTVSGATEKPLTDVLRMRLREVAIHHVDLGAGHTFGDEDRDVLIELTRDAARRFSLSSDSSIDLLIDGVTVGAISSDQVAQETSTVDLSGGAMLGWLTGRDTSLPGRPALPAWG